MNSKQIDTSREVRLWIGQVIVPVLTGGIILAANPNVRNWVASKVSSIKQHFKKN